MLLAKMSIGKRIACSRLSDSGVRREEREGEKIRRKRGREEPRSRPPPPSLFVCLSLAPISLRCPQDLNAWNKLGKEKIGTVAKTKNSTGIARKNY